MLQYEGGAWRTTQNHTAAANEGEHNPAAAQWVSEYRFSARPPVRVRLLEKSDDIMQGGRAISAYDALASSCIMHARGSIPVLLDADGVLCAAGETLLARTICMTAGTDDEKPRGTCVVRTAYGRMHILVQ